MDYELGYDLDEALKRENLSLSDLKSLRTPPVDGVPANITDKQLLLFYNGCNKNIEFSRKVMKIYYDSRRIAPEHFSSRDPKSERLQQCFGAQHYVHLPLTPDGNYLVFHRLSDFKSSSYHLDHAVTAFFMSIDLYFYKQGPRPGLIFLFDMKGVSLSHLTRLSVKSIKRFIQYLQDGLPAKLQAIHILNVVPFFDKILSIMKPFMKADIINMMHMHTSSLDFNEFYEKHLPKSCLPSDFGGDLASVDELHKECVLDIMKHREYFLAEELQRNDGKSINSKIGETEDKFKKLDFD